MIVIGFTGLPGAGKTAAIDGVRDLGSSISMGDVIRRETKIRNLEPTDENLGNTARSLRAEGGNEIIAKKCIELINELDSEVVYIDGIRSFLEVTVFRQEWTFPLIAIDTSEQIRFERLKKRARHDDPKVLDDLRERDNREIGFGVQEAVEKADKTINNDDISIEKLKKKTRVIVLELLKNFN